MRLVVWFQIPSVFWLSGRNNFSQLLSEHRVDVVRQTEIHTSEQLEPESGAFKLRWLLKS